MTDVSRDELAARLGEVVLLDVRTPAEYRGEQAAPCDPRAGRIPGAANLDLNELIQLSPEAIRARVGAPAGAEVIAYCHSGSRSRLAVQLLRAAGYEARNYAGSWHEWSREPSLPAETG